MKGKGKVDKDKNHYNQGICVKSLGVTETSTKLNTFMTNSLKKCIAICACVKN